MENNIDYREIVQTVTSNILEDVKSQLASIQPGIVDDIVQRIEASIQPSLESFANQLSDLQKRVSELEHNPVLQTSPPTPVRTRSVPVINVVGRRRQEPVISETANTSSDPPQMDTQTRVLLLKIKRWLHIIYKGWIIYFNSEDRHTYIIRENGTDQKDISSFFKGTPCRFYEAPVENGSDWIIEYRNRDTDARDFAVIPMP